MEAFRSAARKTKHASRVLLGRDLWIRPDIGCPFEILGNLNAQFAINAETISQNAIVYCFGIGTDISFDLALMVFDPTPRSLNWLQTQEIPSRFHVHNYRVADSDGVVGFTLPLSPSHVSHTIVHRNGSE